MEQLNEFIVFVREVWIQSVKVKAMSLAQAVQRVENGEGETIESGFELSLPRTRVLDSRRRRR